MRVIAYERGPKSSEHDIHRDPDREEETGGDDVHSRERIDSSCTANCKDDIE